MWFSLLFVLLLSIFSHSKIQFCNSPNRLSYFYLSSIYLSPSLCILSVLLPPAHLLLWVHKHRWWNTHICLHVHTHTLPFCSAPAPPPSTPLLFAAHIGGSVIGDLPQTWSESQWLPRLNLCGMKIYTRHLITHMLRPWSWCLFLSFTGQAGLLIVCFEISFLKTWKVHAVQIISTPPNTAFQPEYVLACIIYLIPSVLPSAL